MSTKDNDAFATYDDWRRWRDGAWPADQRKPRQPTDCPLCAGTRWVPVPDPFFDGALVDQRCPACCDLTIRAETSRWEDDHGRKVGPT